MCGHVPEKVATDEHPVVLRALIGLHIILHCYCLRAAAPLSKPENEAITFFLLRGIGREAGHWGNTVPNHLRDSYPHARFVLMDLPGAGRYYNKPALPTVEKMADFLRTEYLGLIDSIPGKKVIVATSLAGNVALEWITQYPRDFHGAILLSTSLKGICKNKDRVQSEAKKEFIDIFLINDLTERERAFLAINSNLNVNNDSLLTAWSEIQTSRPVSKGALLKQTVAGMVYRPKKGPRSIPILLIGSNKDKIVAQKCFEDIAQGLDCDLYLHPSAGHGIPIDAPKWLADTSSYWIEKEVLTFEHPAAMDTMHFVTRKKNNGLFPLRWFDRGVSSTVKSAEDAFQATGKVFTGGWLWMDDSMEWMDKLLKEVPVEDKAQKRQLKELKRNLKKEQKELQNGMR